MRYSEEIATLARAEMQKMRNFDKRAFCVATALLFLVVLTGIGYGKSNPAAGFEMRKVFEFKPESWRKWPKAVLDPAGNKVFLLQGSRLQVINWRQKRIVASRRYAESYCQGDPYFYGWHFIPNHSQILAVYCGSLFLVDGESFDFVKRLISGPPDYVVALTVSPDGKRAAIATYRPPSRGGPRSQILVLQTTSWHLAKRWDIESSSLAFSNDGELLAITRTLVDDRKRLLKCGVEIRHVDSGELYSEWWRGAQEGCLDSPRFVPDHPELVATNRARSFDVFTLELWDWKSGQLVREIPFEHRSRGGALFSPDWRWAIGTAVDDPQDSPEFIQDFIVWDVSSGKIIYQTPKTHWTSIPAPNRVPHGSLELASISSDGRFLLVVRYEQVLVYEIVGTSGK